MPSIIDRNNRILAEPTLADLMTLFKKQIFLDLNCHAIGTVKSFDSTQQTATVAINYKKTFFQKNAVGIQLPVQQDYPALIDAPVIIMQGGPVSLTFPITAGDECLVLFNDRDIDNWYTSGQVGPLATQRLHSYSDGMILVGLNSILRKIVGYDTTRGILKYKLGGEVGVGPVLVRIANQITTLNTVLQNLVTAIEGITTTPTVPGNPALLSPASIAALAAVGLQISSLLE